MQHSVPSSVGGLTTFIVDDQLVLGYPLQQYSTPLVLLRCSPCRREGVEISGYNRPTALVGDTSPQFPKENLEFCSCAIWGYIARVDRSICGGSVHKTFPCSLSYNLYSSVCYLDGGTSCVFEPLCLFYNFLVWF
jgi:hypothetical protein